MSSWAKLLLIVGTVVAVGIGLWTSRTQEVIALITTVYVILVFLQLDLMKKQHEAAQRERKEMLEHEKSRQPVLSLPDMCLRSTTEFNNVTRTTLGQAWYINSTITNVGGGIANHVQPVLTNAAERLPDKRWRRFPDWMALGLRWCLDEINGVQGTPTQDRHLVPHRPYEFDLGKLSTYLPSAKFQLCSLILPAAQPNEFGAGEYCFEITAYSANASPVSAWYLVTVDRDIHAPNPLRVEQLKSAPWE